MDATELLKAKAEAVRALVDAMNEFGGANREAIRFAKIWAQAVESMIPAAVQAIGDPFVPDSEVTRWRDRVGDVWVRNSGGGWRIEEDPDDPETTFAHLSDLAQAWGPMTRADRS